MGEYQDRLVATKQHYPFKGWEESGLEQYTITVTAAFTAIFDKLILELSVMGETAPEEQKLNAFKTVVMATNELNEEDESIIETGEREDLCGLCNIIARAAGMDTEKYGGGEGPATMWRDW